MARSSSLPEDSDDSDEGWWDGDEKEELYPAGTAGSARDGMACGGVDVVAERRLRLEDIPRIVWPGWDRLRRGTPTVPVR